jgi:hypothetical protein
MFILSRTYNFFPAVGHKGLSTDYKHLCDLCIDRVPQTSFQHDGWKNTLMGTRPVSNPGYIVYSIYDLCTINRAPLC